MLKYALFISFFPQILQGPIPRYEYLSHQLIEGNEFDPDNIQRGFQLILWGFFLKYMIADKAGVVVNTVFDNASAYSGLYYAVAGSLYSLQLYTDFLACTTLSKGAAVLFGIRLPENFNHPYFANSIRDFWRRWHISLSTWLRDYIYIPLGGNRKGKGRKYLNLVITFLISGVWHGGTLKYMFWGFLHGVYQIVGEMTYKIRDHICMVFGLDYDSKLKNVLQTIVTFIFVTLGWIIFRADTLQNGLHMIRSIAVDFNPWVLSGTYLFNMGLSQNECVILMISVLLLFGVSLLQERGYKIGESVMNLHVVFRYVIYLAGILIVMIYGTYGFGFNASDFIYRGF
ncbi:MBOAT family O-acyltransferase [Bacillota bacterium LCP21S3_F9]